MIPAHAIRKFGVPAISIILAVAACAAAAAADWTVRPDRIGSIRVGTPFAALKVPLKQPVRTTDFNAEGSCYYATPDLPQEFNLMIENGVVTAVDVMKPGVRTAEGIGVGDPVAKVRQAYGKLVRSTPDAYDSNQQELTILSKDGKFAIRFYTADGEVSAFIAGRIKSVNYMEGCL